MPGIDFRGLLAEASGTALPIDDVLHLSLPLLRQVSQLHLHGRVAVLAPSDIVMTDGRRLQLRHPDGQLPRQRIEAVRALQPHPGSGLNVVGRVQVTNDSESGLRVDNLEVQEDPSVPPEQPVYLPGFGSWELALGHHDEITDLFLLGQLLACLACGLDFDDAADLRRFAAHRRNLFHVHPRLNPVLANVIAEMTALNRHDRATDLAEVVRRLETWRDQPASLDVDRVLADASGANPRRVAVLSHLRDRLFDLSRRNRLLHFRATQGSVNLTMASVPLVLQLESIRPAQLCAWGGAFAEDVLSCKAVPLQRWLRFDDQPYLPGSLDRIVQDTRRDRAEFGFSHLRLVVAFLRWHNLKDAPEDRIVSPMLWLPVELVKKKGVRDQYVLQCQEEEAEFNPALRHYLRQLYDIRLPDTVDLRTTTIEAIHADLQAQIHRTEPGVELRLQSKPSIELIHQKAVQHLRQFQRRRGRQTPAVRAEGRPEFSYAADDFRPLGLALFRERVLPSPLPLRNALASKPTPRHPEMAGGIAVAERGTFSVARDEGHRFAWDLDLTQVTLANFNYKKMSLVRDYAQLIEDQPDNAAFDRLFSIDPRPVETTPPPPLPANEQWNVVPADATQAQAVGLARTGRSFIIQGPPGTGKSQTITNLIADYAARGQRVLFVCEKRAAIDVVFHRLKQCGLDDLCSLIHDSQGDKRAFVADLRACYERWVAAPVQRDHLAASRAGTLSALESQLQRIEHHETLLSSTPGSLACRVRELVRRLAALPTAPDGVPAEARERLPDFATWQAHRDLTARLQRTVHERLGAPSLARHPFRWLSGEAVADPLAFGRIKSALDDVEAQLAPVEDQLDAGPSWLDADAPVADAAALAGLQRELVDSGLARHGELLAGSPGATLALQQQRTGLLALAGTLEQASAAAANWREPLQVADTQAALGLATRLEPSVLRWLQPTWWKLRGEIARRYDFSRHAVAPSLRTVLGWLSERHAAARALQQARQALAAQYGSPDADRFLAAADALQARRGKEPLLGRWLVSVSEASDPLASADRDARTAAVLSQVQARASDVLAMPPTLAIGALAEALRDLRENLEDLPDLLPLLRAMHQAGQAYTNALCTLPLPPDEMEALVAAEALARIQREEPGLAQFDGQALARAVATVAAADARLLDQNAALVRATQHQKFLDNVRRSSLSATQLDGSGREFKKRYSTGRRELEHEFGKTMRHRSIREMSGGDSGLVVKDLKPIWLMSPLSVSDTLPLAPDLFDVVIFDEASQIPTEEAVPALSRARQSIVVGDEMQLPPTSFFSTGGDEEDNEVVAEEDGARVAITLDADSLLSQAARNLPATLLAWHYRSRHEALISFSNAAFYDGRLVTIPDRRIDQVVDALAPCRSDQDDAGSVGADALLATPISFHVVADGLYEDRCNPPEAAYIARLVRELLRRESGHSIGVVAFSEAQQAEIEAALEALAATDAEFATALEKEFVREDDDQFNGLFVKNLENVQGDERDVIILSICYAPGRDGRMLMNFGPINQRGGEKRLNVIFSRAKHRMAVVSTIRAEAITNVHNDGAAALRAFLQFAEASARGETERSQAVLGALNPGAQQAFASQPPRDAIRSAIAAALRARGHEVREHVGRSSFRCDLGIVAPDHEGYALAVLLDPETQTDDPRQRYVFRPAILRAFGWRVLDLPCLDWLRAPEAVLARIESLLAGANEPALSELAPDVPTPASAAPGPAPDVPAGTAADASRSLLFEEGGSSKFWRISRSGGELTITFGRIGTRGQSLLKAYESVERADREMAKLVDEKLRKGYLDAAP
ncbi:DUF4011 domain-containing protein [Arenimonas terrae]|uniref:DUF4011 domain-containing protein n=2 Tax=Arenimonas terrae TaxID=2546226 RepID=A0A5C4RQQ4_9GAMM|nr:DUF4011 domain-containing protein [Arenimonas terrae]